MVTRHLPKEEFTHRQERGKLVQNQLQLSGNTCWDFSLLPMLTNRHRVGTTPVKFHNGSPIPHTLFEVHAPKTVKKLLAWLRKRVGEVVWVIWLAKNVFSLPPQPRRMFGLPVLWNPYAGFGWRQDRGRPL